MVASADILGDVTSTGAIGGSETRCRVSLLHDHTKSKAIRYITTSKSNICVHVRYGIHCAQRYPVALPEVIVNSIKNRCITTTKQSTKGHVHVRYGQHCTHRCPIVRPWDDYMNSIETRYHYVDVIMSTMASQITNQTDCLLNRLFRRRSKKTSKLRVTGLCEGNSPVTGEFPVQRTSNVENVSIWWRHYDNHNELIHTKTACAC